LAKDRKCVSRTTLLHNKGLFRTTKNLKTQGISQIAGFQIPSEPTIPSRIHEMQRIFLVEYSWKVPFIAVPKPQPESKINSQKKSVKKAKEISTLCR
jgi:hypothetical protein